MELKVLKIPLSHIDSVTKTIVQVRGPVWDLRTKSDIDNDIADSDRCTRTQ